MLYVKPVPDVDILFTIVTVYLSVFFSHSCCLPVSGEIKLYIYRCIIAMLFDAALIPMRCRVYLTVRCPSVRPPACLFRRSTSAVQPRRGQQISVDSCRRPKMLLRAASCREPMHEAQRRLCSKLRCSVDAAI